MELPENLRNKIELIPESGCWVWMGSITVHGYGHIRIDGKNQRVHRVAYTAMVGPIPDGLVLDHLCRVRCCINPAHLEPVTHKENILRGISPQALNAKKTHCVKGHELTDDNLLPYVKWRQCKTCWIEWRKQWRLDNYDKVKAEKDAYNARKSKERAEMKMGTNLIGVPPLNSESVSGEGK